jgi:AGZA family xanthine/uracil permease-like MFS transporter
MLERFFGLRDAGTTVRTEVGAGVATFITMSYIIFLQPAVLSTDFAGNPTGLSADAVMLATCLSAFLATMIMGLWANYPFALAPGMGENYFFVTVIMSLTAMGVANSWRVAMGIVLLSGILFFLLNLLRVREAVITAIPPGLKSGIAAGIGLFIALIGLQNAGLVVQSPATGLTMNPDLFSADLLVFLFGLLLTGVLMALRVRGAVLWALLASTMLAMICGKVKFEGLLGVPKDHAIFGFDLVAAFDLRFLPFIVIFLFMDMFDTVGTLVGVGQQGGFMRDNKLPRANRALMADAVGTVAGACMGTSTVTTYAESAVGVEQGGRTGLASVVTGLLFLLALFFTPLAAMVGTYPPITAPALVVVGAMMIRGVTGIDWKEPAEGISAFLILAGIPFCFSISDGMALGFIAYPLIMLLSGRGRRVSWLLYLVALLFILRYVLLPVR